MSEARPTNITGPSINVTPLIDVLLVLLIIFMVAAPLRPHRFATKLPSPPDNRIMTPDIRTLVVTIEVDGSLKLNALTNMGTVNDMTKINEKLVSLFEERLKNHTYSDAMATRSDVPEKDRIERTVFIKAPKVMAYGEIARVIDGLKGSGAEPIGLQLDGLQ